MNTILQQQGYVFEIILVTVVSILIRTKSLKVVAILSMTNYCEPQSWKLDFAKCKGIKILEFGKLVLLVEWESWALELQLKESGIPQMIEIQK